MSLRISAWATGILIVVIALAGCGGGGESEKVSGPSGTTETVAQSSPSTKSSAPRPLTVHAAPPYGGSMSPNFVAFAELVNENDVPVDIDSVTLRLLDASGGEIAHSELPYGLSGRPTDQRSLHTIGGQALDLRACATPIAPQGELGLELRVQQTPADIASYQLEVTARETHVAADAFSVSDVVQSADEDYPSGTATQIDARVTNRSAETQGNVSVCCGFYDHDVLYTVVNSFLYTFGSSDPPSIESLAPGESAPFRCGSSGDPNVLQPKFWVQSHALSEQLDEEWRDSVSGGQ